MRVFEERRGEERQSWQQLQSEVEGERAGVGGPVENKIRQKGRRSSQKGEFWFSQKTASGGGRRRETGFSECFFKNFLLSVLNQIQVQGFDKCDRRMWMRLGRNEVSV